MSRKRIDWSKAGTRLRHTPRQPGGPNPDWDWVHDRWKDEADYAADAMTLLQLREAVSCMTCRALRKQPCYDAREQAMTDDVHPLRRRHAGEKAVANGKG